jgi:DNA-binding XRE family transcriptional regulator
MIYLISCDDKFLKIGYTKNIKKRLRELQTSNPIKLELCHLIDGDVNLEKELHFMFKYLRSQGEWFDFDNSILQYFADKECLMWKYGFVPEEKVPVIGLIKQERISRKMSLDSLAQLYGCTPQSIKEIELREIQGRLTIGILYKMARLFNKKFEYRFK